MRTSFVVTLIVVLLWYAAHSHAEKPVVNTPTPPVVKPVKPRRPLFPRGDAEAGSHVGGPTDGSEEVQCDLPESQHLRNKGGSDGAGLCVFTSIDMAAQWSNFPTLIGFRDYMTHYPGGGYPSKVKQYIEKIARERNLPVPVDGVDYGQFTDGNPETLKTILNNRLIACVTYGYSPRYGQTIAHMVCLVKIGNKVAAILDNNFPGTIEWMDDDTFIQRWKMNGGGWGFWLNLPPPPPVPVN